MKDRTFTKSLHSMLISWILSLERLSIDTCSVVFNDMGFTFTLELNTSFLLKQLSLDLLGHLAIINLDTTCN